MSDRPETPEHFRVRAALDHGVPAGVLRGPGFVAPFHGVRARELPTTTLDRCRAYLPRMRDDQFFTRLTAAALLGAPVASSAVDTGVDIGAFRPRQPPRARGVRPHSLEHAGTTIIDRHGLPVTDPASTWAHLGQVLPVDELVVVGDFLVNGQGIRDPGLPHPDDMHDSRVLDPGRLDPRVHETDAGSHDRGDPRIRCDLADLSARVALFHGPGRLRLDAALPLIRVGSGSRPETLLRLMLERDGLPEPEVNGDIVGADGRVIGRGGLVFRTWRVIVEYSGDNESTTPEQLELAQQRTEALTLAGWLVIPVRSSGLFVHPDETFARIRRALAAHGWKARDAAPSFRRTHWGSGSGVAVFD